MPVSVLLLASGRSTRFGGVNKLNLDLTPGVTLVEHCIRNIEKSRVADRIVITVNDETESRVDLLKNRSGLPLVVVQGGLERKDSVLNGLEACTGDKVLIHDAARPFASPELFMRVLSSISDKCCAIPFVGIADTIYQVDESGNVFGTANRESLKAVQTPQGFPLQLLLNIHRGMRTNAETITDDGSLFLNNGYGVELVEGEKNNIKITYPADLEIARIMAIKAGILEGMRIGN